MMFVSPISRLTANNDQILIFRTNIMTHEDKSALARRLEADPAVSEWSVDLEDVDKVLRIISPSYNEKAVISLIASLGFSCEELD